MLRSPWKMPLNFEEARSYQQLLARERDRLRLLLDVNNNVISHLELSSLFQAISSALRDCFHHEYTGLWLFEEGLSRLRCVGMDFPGNRGFIPKIQSLDLTPAEVAEVRSRAPRLMNHQEIAQLSPDTLRRPWRKTSARGSPFLWSRAPSRSAS